jgi:cyclase
MSLDAHESRTNRQFNLKFETGTHREKLMAMQKSPVAAAFAAIFALALPAYAQVVDPHVTKVAEGVYVYVGRNFGPSCSNANCVESNAGIVLTNAGVVLIDTGQNPTDSRELMKTVRTLTQLPILYVLHTEPHPDHTTGDFIFSPPATVIAHRGATEEMKSRPANRVELLAKTSPEMAAAAEGYRMVIPEEFDGKKTLTVGERTFELFYLKNVHSEADVGVWLPRERVLFSASGVVVKQWNVFRPFVGIPDILAGIKMMKALNPEVVVPGHGAPGTVKIFEDTEAHYALLLDRVGRMMREGKTLDQIKKEARFPEYDDWLNKGRAPGIIEAAYRTLAEKR